jgi:radical SAM superfamily enzyme YgiQ (UPF0313 family)
MEYSKNNRKKIVLISFNDRISMSTRVLSSVLKENGHQSYLLFLKDDRSRIIDDFNMNARCFQYFFNDKIIGCLGDINPPTRREYDLLVERVVEINPDVVGISARSAVLYMARQVVRFLRQRLPKVRYFGGGYGPTCEPQKFLQFLDFVCLGEGEKVVSDMVSSDNPRTVPNTAWMEGGKLRYNPLADPEVLEDSVWPDWDPEDKYLIEDDTIRPMAECYDLKTYDIFTSRGCPGSCTYCMASQWNRIYERYGKQSMPKIRLRSPESVINELIRAKEKFQICRVYFKDSIFGFSRKWFFEFMDMYDKHIHVPFIALLEPQFTDEDRIKRLRASGLDKTTVGIQAVSYQIRKEIMGRDSTNNQIVDYAHMLIRNRVGIHYDIMHWNPFDTIETMEDGLTFLKRLPKGEDVVVSQTHILPGSRLEDLYREKQPSPVSPKVFEYYAWLYQMILYSEKTEMLVDSAIWNPYYRDHPRALRKLFQEAITGSSTKYGIVASRDIHKGEILTGVMIDRYKNNKNKSLPWDEKHRVLTKAATHFIPKGNLIQLSDFYGRYDYKYNN